MRFICIANSNVLVEKIRRNSNACTYFLFVHYAINDVDDLRLMGLPIIISCNVHTCVLNDYEYQQCETFVRQRWVDISIGE